MFRSEVAKAKQDRLQGKVFLILPPSTSMLISLTLMAGSIVMLFLVFGTYAHSERVTGTLILDPALVRVKAPRSGTIQTLYASQGAFVEQGDILAKITYAHDLETGASVYDLSIQNLDAQKGLLTHRIQNLGNEYDRRRKQAETTIKVLGAELQSLARQRTLQDEIVQSSEQAFKDAEQLLTQGYISKVEMEKRRQLWLSHIQQQLSFERQSATVHQKLQETNLVLSLLPQELEDKTSELKEQLLDLGQQTTETHKENYQLLRAPASGIITSIYASAPAHAVNGADVLAIAPQGSRIRASLQVPSRSAGQLDVGQVVYLSYASYPAQKYGRDVGRIASVSTATKIPDEADVGYGAIEPFYRVIVDLPDKTNNALISGKWPLYPGMKLEGDIVLERRSFLSWVLEPLRAMKG